MKDAKMPRQSTMYIHVMYMCVYVCIYSCGSYKILGGNNTRQLVLVVGEIFIVLEE